MGEATCFLMKPSRRSTDTPPLSSRQNKDSSSNAGTHRRHSRTDPSFDRERQGDHRHWHKQWGVIHTVGSQRRYSQARLACCTRVRSRGWPRGRLRHSLPLLSHGCRAGAQDTFIIPVLRLPINNRSRFRTYHLIPVAHIVRPADGPTQNRLPSVCSHAIHIPFGFRDRLRRHSSRLHLPNIIHVIFRIPPNNIGHTETAGRPHVPSGIHTLLASSRHSQVGENLEVFDTKISNLSHNLNDCPVSSQVMSGCLLP